MRKFARLLISATSLLLLSGCAGEPSAGVLEVTEAPAITEEDPAADSTPTDSPVDFTSVAISSCERAMSEGVEEQTAAQAYRQVMIPKSAALDGYSAAWEDLETGEIGLIWEADAFLSCAPAMTIWLAEESGESPAWEIAELESGFELFQDFGEYGTQLIRFEVVDGVFSTAEVVGGELFEIRYGEPNLADAQELIARAVADFES